MTKSTLLNPNRPNNTPAAGSFYSSFYMRCDYLDDPPEFLYVTNHSKTTFVAVWLLHLSVTYYEPLPFF